MNKKKLSEHKGAFDFFKEGPVRMIAAENNYMYVGPGSVPRTERNVKGKGIEREKDKTFAALLHRPLSFSPTDENGNLAPGPCAL